MSEKWTAARIALAIGLFILAGFAEIGGCYLVWKTFRLKQHALYAVAGAVTLLASVVPKERRWDVLNPASMKQALVEGATRIGDGGGPNAPKIYEQARP